MRYLYDLELYNSMLFLVEIHHAAWREELSTSFTLPCSGRVFRRFHPLFPTAFQKHLFPISGDPLCPPVDDCADLHQVQSSVGLVAIVYGG